MAKKAAKKNATVRKKTKRKVAKKIQPLRDREIMWIWRDIVSLKVQRESAAEAVNAADSVVEAFKKRFR